MRKCECQQPVKIAICGPLRSGKDMATAYLSLFYGFTPYAFGDSLKAFLFEIFPNVPREPKPRHLLQRFGQIMREIDENVWLDACLRKVERNNDSLVLISDLRQPNEYERLKAEGYVIIRLHADTDVRVTRAIEAGDNFTVHDLIHETETNLDKFDVDYCVENNTTPDLLYDELDAIMFDLGVEKTVRGE